MKMIICCSPKVIVFCFFFFKWSVTHRWSGQAGEASLSTLSRKTHNTTLSSQTLRAGGTIGTLQEDREKSTGHQSLITNHHEGRNQDAHQSVPPTIQWALRSNALSLAFNFQFIAPLKVYYASQFMALCSRSHPVTLWGGNWLNYYTGD